MRLWHQYFVKLNRKNTWWKISAKQISDKDLELWIFNDLLKYNDKKRKNPVKNGPKFWAKFTIGGGGGVGGRGSVKRFSSLLESGAEGDRSLPRYWMLLCEDRLLRSAQPSCSHKETNVRVKATEWQTEGGKNRGLWGPCCDSVFQLSDYLAPDFSLCGIMGREGGGREWDGCMASLTQWIWVCTSSGRWWRTRKPSVCGVTESNMTEPLNNNKSIFTYC